MAYRFSHHDKNVEAGLRRIASQQIEKAIAEIDDSDLPQAKTIHQVRKRCKKLRGLIRLVRPVFDAYADENTRIRDAARELSGARDSDVLIETLDKLVAGQEGSVDEAEVAAVRERLLARRPALEPDADPEAQLAGFREEMVAALERTRNWSLSAKGYSAIAGGLEKTYRRGRQALPSARTQPSAENIHEWRKRVKYHGYHTRLLTPIWPALMKARVKEASRLGDLLGDHHDLSIFASILAEDFRIVGNPATQEALVRLVLARQNAIEKEAFGVGARLYAERPDALVKSWRACWRVWRKEGKAKRAEQPVALAAE